MFDIQDVCIENLPSLKLSDRHLLPWKSGIYFLTLEQTEVLYIGKTLSVRGFRGRWDKENHHTFKKIKAEGLAEESLFLHYFSVVSKEISLEFEKQLDVLEMRLILLYKPRLNGAKLFKVETIHGVNLV